MTTRKIKWPKITRDSGLFLVGLALTINEAILREGERPYLLMLFAGMMGLPVFLRSDEKKQDEPTPPAAVPAPPSPTPVPTPPPVPEVPTTTQDGGSFT